MIVKTRLSRIIYSGFCMEWKYSVDTSSDVQGEIFCQLFQQVSQPPHPPGVGDVPGEREE